MQRKLVFRTTLITTYGEIGKKIMWCMMRSIPNIRKTGTVFRKYDEAVSACTRFLPSSVVYPLKQRLCFGEMKKPCSYQKYLREKESDSKESRHVAMQLLFKIESLAFHYTRDVVNHYQKTVAKCTVYINMAYGPIYFW